jgi:UDP-glucuronate 4-epimerase
MRVLITGAAGFIGFHCSRSLLCAGHEVLGFDDLNSYYDPRYKQTRLDTLAAFEAFSFVKGDVADERAIRSAWRSFRPEWVLHLAAQAGVRYSLENPRAYLHSNIVAFQNVIDLARETRPANFVYASSSSVYGNNERLPFRESDEAYKPISLYAATKISNEVVARAYGHLFELPMTGLRFFSVYGPFDRPDRALFRFAEAITNDRPIQVFNGGRMVRDFTYIDDLVTGIVAALKRPQVGQIYNLGRGKAVELTYVIDILEARLGKKAVRQLLPLQAGDVRATVADVSKARAELGYDPQTDVEDGVARFVDWYLSRRPSERLGAARGGACAPDPLQAWSGTAKTTF